MLFTWQQRGREVKTYWKPGSFKLICFSDYLLKSPQVTQDAHARVCLCACLHVCVCACLRVCMRVCVRACDGSHMQVGNWCNRCGWIWLASLCAPHRITFAAHRIDAAALRHGSGLIRYFTPNRNEINSKTTQLDAPSRHTHQWKRLCCTNLQQRHAEWLQGDYRKT